MQEYQPLTNFLRHQAASCIEKDAQQSINAQLAYTAWIHSGQKTPEQLQGIAERMAYLKRRWRATFTDNRPAYHAKPAASVSRLQHIAQQLREAA